VNESCCADTYELGVFGGGLPLGSEAQSSEERKKRGFEVRFDVQMKFGQEIHTSNDEHGRR
jgi:hypothetical protein